MLQNMDITLLRQESAGACLLYCNSLPGKRSWMRQMQGGGDEGFKLVFKEPSEG